MGFKKYLPLKPKEIESTLKRFGFVFKRQVGSHCHWEGTVNGKRRIVTVPQYSEIASRNLLKSIFEQSGVGLHEFYR